MGYKNFESLMNQYREKHDSEILDFLKLSVTEKFVVLRFVSWNAAHDWGMHGFTLNEKISLAKCG